ncbi:MAG: winged helix-turn-helix transcriptional regulator [Rhizobiales bacterium]|nr:winged helix-turn-helix transcriptional regulator [Hyphomicrobiales bacterium]
MTFNLEKFLPYRLRILYDTITHSFSPIYIKQYKLSPSEWRVLASIAGSGSVTAKQLGKHSRMHKTKVSRAVFELSKRNLIVKVPNKNDLRETFLEVSELGGEMYRKLSIRAIEFDNKMLSCLTQNEQLALDEIIEKLQKHAETNFYSHD